jgi:tol-pal system protein YbgF
MKKSILLLLVSIFGLVLMAPPAYPQKTQDQLNALMRDSLNLQNTVKQLQESLDQKSAETNKLLQEVLTRFTAIDASMKTLNDSLTAVSSSMKTNNDKAARDLETTKTALEGLRKNVDEGMLGLQTQIRGLNTKVNDLGSKEVSLPTAAALFNQAHGELNAGFYSIAVDDFREFLKNYPNDPVRSPAAQFYIGDAMMAQKKFDQALVEFDLVLSKYPSSDKKCTALYYKGRAHAELKQVSQATTVMDNVVKECPGTQEAANAAADRKNLPRPQRGQ